MKNRRQFLRAAAGTVLCSFCGSTLALGQKRFSADWKCSYDGEEFEDQIYTFQSDQEAEAAVQKILKYSGLEPNFVTMAANVPNAMATIRDQKRYILYNQNFMEQMEEQTRSKWAALSILAHEIAHHLQGHTVQGGGSNPTIELEADKFSGFVLCTMGATQEQARLTMETFGSAQASSTHPGKRDRLLAITNGWKASKELRGIRVESPERRPDPEDAPTTRQEEIPERAPDRRHREMTRAPISGDPSQGAVQPSVVSKCIFTDGGVSLVLSNNQIVTQNQFGQTVPIAVRQPSNNPSFAWIYQTSTSWFGVTREGLIMGQNYGRPAQVGYVTEP